MKAMLLRETKPAEERPLELVDLLLPDPGPGEVRLRVQACGICRTDLPKLPLVPGHQIVGVVESAGGGAVALQNLRQVCVLPTGLGEPVCRCPVHRPACRWRLCRGDDRAGGFCLRHSRWFYRHCRRAAPVRGHHRLPRAQAERDQAGPAVGDVWFWRLGSRHHSGGPPLGLRGIRLYPQRRASGVGAPVGCDVGGPGGGYATQEAARLHHLCPGGQAGAGCAARAGAWGHDGAGRRDHGPIPEIDYDRLLYWGRGGRSVANFTRQDAQELLQVAAEIPIETTVQTSPLEEANEALLALKCSEIDGTAVLVVQ
jgi:propanol-preferring alcohol dehydrogenase